MAHPNRLHRLRNTHAVSLLALIAFLAAGCTGLVGPAEAGAAEQAVPLPVDPNVPTPESVLGHAPENQPVAYDALVRYLHALADATPRVMLTPYGESYEGRTLYHLTITSEANHARLAEIQADNAKLADPRKLAAGETAETIAGRLPAVAWLGYSIHGDELSSTDAAIRIAYELAARMDATMRQWRDDMVIHVDPLMNPDGRSRYLAQLEHLSGMVPNPDYQSMQHRGLWSAGRGNHYLFDLNRDWLMQAHPETRGRIQAVLSWNPHLVVDSHEMGGLETYLFSPPREPINTYIPEKVMDWRRRFSADQARAFDRHGWSYYTREWNEEWYVGYTNSWTALLGIVSILYEQAGVDGTSVRQPAGVSLTYAESVQHHIVSTMANLATLHANRREIVNDLVADRQWAVSDAGPYNETFLLPPSPDRSRQERFIDLMRRQGIEMEVAQAPVEASGVENVWHQKVETLTFPAGTLVIRSAQPHRRLLHGMLAFDPRMSTESLVEEREELERRGDTRIYDVTAWNLPMAYGLDAYWAERIADVETAPPTQRDTGGSPVRVAVERPYGYLIDFADSAVYRLVGRLLEHGAKLRVATRAFTIGDRAYQPGAILLRGHENSADIAKILDQAADGLRVDITAVDTALSQAGPDLGAERFVLLQEPRVAVACQWPISPQSFGSTWYWLDARIGLRVSLVNAQYLRHFDLRKYNVLVLPDAYGADALAGVLGDDGLKRLKTWVEAGGTLIAIGGAAQCLTHKDRGLSAVRLRRDVLETLPVYAEYVARERQARNITVDPEAIWATGQRAAATTQATATTKPAAPPKPDKEELSRQDEWQRRFSPWGSILAATLDAEHWLCFGLDERLPVLFGGSACYMTKPPVTTPVRFVEASELRLSGLLWPEARDRIADTAYATVESVGYGQVVLFAGDPTFRGYFEGPIRLLLNAVLLGPGAGTSTPLPW